LSEAVLALVPARGGSKSLPRKNLKLLAGHPLLAYSVQAAREAAEVTRVLVSTDDPEIRDVALAYGAEAPFLRPPSLARDHTTDWPVFAHALSWLEQEEDYRPGIVVQLRPTSPLRPAGLIDAGVRLLRGDPRADSVRAVTPPSQNPFKMWRIEEGYLRPLLGDALSEPYNMPRQALPDTYWQTGHLDVVRTRTIQAGRSMTGERVLPLLVEGTYAVDIDTLEQWSLAEALLLSGRVDVVRPAPQTVSARERA
jgi:N-acylneuraminate cytidylyltransferase